MFVFYLIIKEFDKRLSYNVIILYKRKKYIPCKIAIWIEHHIFVKTYLYPLISDEIMKNNIRGLIIYNNTLGIECSFLRTCSKSIFYFYWNRIKHKVCTSNHFTHGWIAKRTRSIIPFSNHDKYSELYHESISFLKKKLRVMYFAKVKRQDFSHKIKEKYCRIKTRF